MVWHAQIEEKLEILLKITILIGFGRHRRFRKLKIFKMKIGGPRDFFYENSGKVVGKPEPENERWNRLTTPRKTQKTYIFPDTHTHTRNSLGEVYGGARVWQESCAWGRDNQEVIATDSVYHLGFEMGHIFSGMLKWVTFCIQNSILQISAV